MTVAVFHLQPRLLISREEMWFHKIRPLKNRFKRTIKHQTLHLHKKLLQTNGGIQLNLPTEPLITPHRLQSRHGGIYSSGDSLVVL